MTISLVFSLENTLDSFPIVAAITFSFFDMTQNKYKLTLKNMQIIDTASHMYCLLSCYMLPVSPLSMQKNASERRTRISTMLNARKMQIIRSLIRLFRMIKSRRWFKVLIDTSVSVQCVKA